MINGPLVIAADMLQKQSPWMKELVSSVLQSRKLFIQHTVREVLFEGYDDDLIELGRTFNSELPDTKGKFMWLFGKNNTDDGHYTAYTGADDLSKLNVITHWNGQPSLNFWKGQTCNMINGSNVEVNPPVKASQTHLRFFRSDLCRSWMLTYSLDSTEHHGLLSKRFSTTKDVIANGTENPDNKCFTVEEELPSGAYDTSTCLFGTPTIMSLPHFYMGDPSYLEAVEGLSPNKPQHDFFVDVEPTSGLSVGITARFQVNLHLRRIPDVVIFEDLKVESLVLPIIWQEVLAAVTEDQAQEIKDKAVWPQDCVRIVYYFLFTLGSVIVLSAGLCLVISWCQMKQYSELDDADSLLEIQL